MTSGKQTYKQFPLWTLFIAAWCVIAGAWAPEAALAAGIPDMPATATAPGQSSTLMPDGRWLLVGGDTDGLRATALLRDVSTTPAKETAVNGHLVVPRAWHTATLLPNGNVLIVGGVDSANQTVDKVELFNTATQSFELLASVAALSRSHHTATVLTDGRVLVAGGADKSGAALRDAAIWNPRTSKLETLSANMLEKRTGHRAALLPSAPVLITGGTDQNGKAVAGQEWFDPSNQNFNELDSAAAKNVLPAAPYSETAPDVEATLPAHGARNVELGAVLSIRFTKPMDVRSINEKTVTLFGPLGAEHGKVVPVESGLLAFMTPGSQLMPGADYTLFVKDAKDSQGNSAPFTAVSFKTMAFTGYDAASESLATSSNSLPKPRGLTEKDDEFWIPDEAHRQGKWRSERGHSSFQDLPPLMAKPGVTALSGQILLLNGKPLNRVTLSIGKQSTQTDETGRFLLENIPTGHQELFINGSTANRDSRKYANFIVGVDIVAAQTTVLPYTSWMPQLDEENAVDLSSPTTEEVILTTPSIPGLEVHLPPGAVIRDRSGNVVTHVGITAIPVDQPPYPLPEKVEVPIYFTIQPGDAFIQNIEVTGARGARIYYPNYMGLAPGKRTAFWHYDPREKGWHIYGYGTVTADGKQVIPDEGVSLYEFTGAMITILTQTPPPDGPKGCEGNGQAGDPVDCATGIFWIEHTDLVVNDIIPIVIRRTYRTNDTQSRRFGIGTNDLYGMFLWTPNPTKDGYLILPNGERIYYVLTSGTGQTADAIYENLDSPTKFYKSTITYGSAAGWKLTLKDGTVYVFRASEYVQEIQDRFGNRLKFDRNTNYTLDIQRLTTPSGRYVDFTYDTGGRVTQLKDNIGRTVSYQYDALNRLIKVTDPSGGITEYSYDSNHRMLTVKNARGIVQATNEYDANGRVSKQTQADGGIYTFSYTLNGSSFATRTDVTDPRGKVRRIEFNALGYVIKETRGLGTAEEQVEIFEREPVTNRVISKTDALNRKTTFVYDYMGNLVSLTKMAGTTAAATNTFTYEPVYNFIATVTDPLNHVTRFNYDSQGNLIKITDALNNVTQFGYNDKGQRTTITNALNKTATLQYSGGDLSGLVDALNRSTNLFTDEVGRVMAVVNALGQTTRYDYDALSRVTQVTDPLNGLTKFSYDANGNLTTVIDPKNGTTTFAYTARDQLQTRTDPLLKAESFVYDGNDNLTQNTDRKSLITGRSYDALNRLKTLTYNDSSTVTYTYDKANRVTQIADSLNGNLSYAYDDLNRSVTATTGQGIVTYTFDAAGRKTRTAVSGQVAIDYGYDNANRLTSITQGTQIVSFSYDAAGRRITKTLPNGTSETYGYDDASQLTSITYKKGTTTLGDLTYSYDSAGRRIKIGGSYARQNIPSATTTTAYNAANQQTNWKGLTQSYDLNGNLTSDGSKTYTWNARNQLTNISGGGITASFQYDALGRRIGKTINGTNTNYLYDRRPPALSSGRI